MDRDIIGTWVLESWYNELPDGSKIYPLGKHVKGYISYSSDGFVFVHIMKADRENYTDSDPFTGSAQEDTAAIKSQISYAGPYEFIDGKLYHHAKVSSFPNWVGTDQIRDVKIIGDRLELSAVGARFQGNTVTAKLIWSRASTQN
ncbi:MAG: lipocalin-like domain-containing protein [Lentilitoribacter sp.]